MSHDYNTILDQLTRVYDNPNKMQETEVKLYAFKQGTDTFYIYIVESIERVSHVKIMWSNCDWENLRSALRAF
jgi:hypothetical protein